MPAAWMDGNKMNARMTGFLEKVLSCMIHDVYLVQWVQWVMQYTGTMRLMREIIGPFESSFPSP